MDATRSRVGSLLEWLLAAGVMAAGLGLGASFVPAGSPAVSAVPTTAEASLLEPPAGVPPRAVSVPMLLLADGRQIRIGDTEAAVDARLGRGARVGLDAVEQNGRRRLVTRFYNDAGTPFVLVFEALGSRAPLHVVGIYLP